MRKTNYFLVLVDSQSKWLEVVPMKTTTSAKTIEVLRNLFASQGLPEEVVSDNGPQFTSGEFKQFLRSNGIKQTLVLAYHPASNGAAERAVQTVKAALLKQVLGEGSQQLTLQRRLANFLLMYRSTPHAVTGVSPAELFLKRQLRTRFSLLKPSLARTVEERQLQQKVHHDKTTSKLRHLSPGDLVHVRNFREGKEKWLRATVVKRLGPVTYMGAERAPPISITYYTRRKWICNTQIPATTQNTTETSMNLSPAKALLCLSGTVILLLG